jgi:hypothetical protein
LCDLLSLKMYRESHYRTCHGYLLLAGCLCFRNRETVFERIIKVPFLMASLGFTFMIETLHFLPAHPKQRAFIITHLFYITIALLAMTISYSCFLEFA